jgi:hypothetical protein
MYVYIWAKVRSLKVTASVKPPDPSGACIYMYVSVCIYVHAHVYIKSGLLKSEFLKSALLKSALLKSAFSKPALLNACCNCNSHGTLWYMHTHTHI